MLVRGLYFYRPFGHSTRLFRPAAAEGGGPSVQQQQQQRPPKPTARSKYGVWYSEMVPAMIPIALLAATVYGVLEMCRSSLAHERQSILHTARIAELERELELERARLRGLHGLHGLHGLRAADTDADTDTEADTDGTGSPVASGPAANSDARRPPATQKGRWW